MKENVEIAQYRQEIQEEIKRLEREGKFDVDVEKDPPTIVLTSDNVDYLREKRTSKIKAKVANKLGTRFFEEMLKKNKLIIKEVKGLENLNKITTGAIITCNHFNPFDSFTVESIFRTTEPGKSKKLFKVI